MLTETEKRDFKEILEMLDDSCLFSLVKTTTNKTVSAGERTEAIDAIITYSSSAEDLLKRKKVSKDILLHFAYKKQLSVTPSLPKEKVIDQLLGHWKKVNGSSVGTTPSAQQSPSDASSFQAGESRSPLGNVTQIASARQNHHPPSPNSTSNNRGGQANLDSTQQSNDVLNVPSTIVYNNVTNVNVNYFNSSPSGNSDLETAGKFVTWFFNMLNSLNPIFHLKPQDFGPHHFWDNAELHLHMATASSSSSENFAGSEHVANRLAAFSAKGMLLFNPNVSENGVFMKSDSHGLKLILVCGSVHKDNACVGMFQQSFGLVKDPRHADAWKVKVTFLKMREGPVSNLPKLQDAEDYAVLEGLTVKALEGAMSP